MFNFFNIFYTSKKDIIENRINNGFEIDKNNIHKDFKNVIK